MTRTEHLDTALRSLDSAALDVNAGSARAVADLERILASDAASPGRLRQGWSPLGARVGRSESAARGWRRVALAGATLSAVTVAVVGLPSLSGGDEAFASWTAVPNGMSEQESADAADICRKETEEAAEVVAPADVDKLSSAQPVIAERRGVWTTVVLAGTGRFSALCITDSSTGLFADGSIGSFGTAFDGSGPRPRELTATSLGVGSMNGRELSLAAGLAGSDIVAVTYRSTNHGPVAATVSQGHFAFWLPGADAELEEASSRGVDVDVTYRDGSTGTSRLTL